MAVTAKVTAFVSPDTEYDQYAGKPALCIEGVNNVQLKDDTDYGFANPVDYEVGAAIIQMGDEYDIIRTNRTGNQPPVETRIPAVRVASKSELLIVSDIANGRVWVLPYNEPGVEHTCGGNMAEENSDKVTVKLNQWTDPQDMLRQAQAVEIYIKLGVPELKALLLAGAAEMVAERQPFNHNEIRLVFDDPGDILSAWSKRE